ncbi:peptidyl-prolyl cis-trans isomerase [Croceicoccus ponticola]|uniref:peptidylprolyl isomerase n=1 Tax=Croceicoccus ponticola TaxID=2217664 RepID=UPI0013E3A2C5|nr:peptidylprolyl isomerase [Croceicoccus ponticola]
MQLLLAGVLLFGADHLVDRADAADAIVVDEDALVRFLQYRHRAFDAPRFRERLDALSGEELAALADEYVEEEALVRKGRALGLDRNDYVARRRLVTQMEYLLEAESGQDAGPITDAEVARYYARHRDTLATGSRYDLRHVYLRQAPGSVGVDVLARLRAGANWRALGDRFAYEREWRDAAEDRLADTFGAEFAEALETLPVGIWSGPVTSKWGAHFVILDERTSGSMPTVELAAPGIRDAIARERVRVAKDRKIAGVLAEYDIVYDDTVRRKSGR